MIKVVELFAGVGGVRPDNGEEILAMCYIAHPNSLVEGAKVREKYLNLVSKGYQEIGIDKKP